MNSKRKTVPTTAADFGISEKTAERFRRLAAIPEETMYAYFKSAKEALEAGDDFTEVTEEGLLAFARKHRT
jgi:hypothetical protein